MRGVEMRRNRYKPYTVELYAPAYPHKGRKVRVHKGSFEENRDFLNPSMISARTVECYSREQAVSEGRLVATLHGAEWEGIVS